MEIPSCRSYHAVLSGVKLLQMADGKSAFKVYYISIVNRDKPELYEWEKCSLGRDDFEKLFRAGGHEGVGFVTAFPHVTKIFRFGPGMETVMDVGVFDTADMQTRDDGRDDGYHEFACYGEAIIAAEEYHAWARAGSVEEYLRYRCDCADFPVVSNRKLGEYWNS